LRWRDRTEDARDVEIMNRWPEKLWIVRHGQSAGNVARDAAHAAAIDRIALDGRDVDVPLSALGEDQSRALGRWFADMPAGERPDVVLVSPYLRAQDTARLIREQGGLAKDDIPLCGDERLREKEFGVLDGLTTSGVANVFPDQAEFRRILGKFYHRPPGGESWCDVILRLRSLLDTVTLHHADQRVLIVAHQVVVLCLRYIIETLDEQAILAIDREGDVANCSVTEYRYDRGSGRLGKLALDRYNYVVPVEDEDVPVTEAPDAAMAARG
jgi:broad specificity phosphatase PhoE